mgnify:CR=1 FL=1
MMLKIKSLINGQYLKYFYYGAHHQFDKIPWLSFLTNLPPVAQRKNLPESLTFFHRFCRYFFHFIQSLRTEKEDKAIEESLEIFFF